MSEPATPADIDPPAAPVARRRRTSMRLFGEEILDDYAWLNDKDRPEVRAYIDEENAYCESMSGSLQKLREQLFQEMRSRLPHVYTSAQSRRGKYFYYWRQERRQAYRLYCRREGSSGAEQVLLDENQLAAGCAGFDLGILEVSPDQHHLLYGIDNSGQEAYALFIKDLSSGEVVERLPVYGGGTAAWADPETFYYSALDPAQRCSLLYRHTLGGSSVLVFCEEDPAFHLAVGRSESGQYLLLALSSRSSEEVRVLDTGQPRGSFRIVECRQPDLQYSISHQDDRFFILTNAGNAPNSQVMEAPVQACGRDHWKTVVPHRADVTIEDIRAFAHHLVLYERQAGQPRIRILDTDSGQMHSLRLGLPACVHPVENSEFDGPILRFGYSSLTRPRSVVEYDMRSRGLKWLRRDSFLNCNPCDYREERILAASADGVRVPISLAYRKNLDRNGQNPLLLYGYGAYGLSVEPAFAAHRLSLLDRGWIFAIAHVRGGGELGSDWHSQGRRLRKRKSFHDFIACAEHLIEEGYTCPQRLAGMGESAGGLLVGVAANWRPDLFRAFVARDPFVDPVHALLDESNPTAAADWEEFGDPRRLKDFLYLLSYSPYENVTSHPYPALLVTTALHDTRVPVGEPLRWTAKLRSCKAGNRPLLLQVNLEAGHGSPSGIVDSLHATAFAYAFLIRQVED